VSRAREAVRAAKAKPIVSLVSLVKGSNAQRSHGRTEHQLILRTFVPNFAASPPSLYTIVIYREMRGRMMQPPRRAFPHDEVR